MLVKMNELEFECSSKYLNKSDDSNLYYSNLSNDSNKYSYFVVNIIDTNINMVTTKEYLNLTYQALLNDDTLEIFKEYRVNKLKTFEREYYFGEFVTTIENDKYMYYMMLFDSYPKVYDIGLKCLLKDKDKYKEILNSIIYSIEIDNEKIFKGEENVEIEQIVL